MPPYLKRVATLPCEIFVLKNRDDPKLSEANFYARLYHSKQLLRNIHPMLLASFLFTDEKIFDHTEKHAEWPNVGYAYPSTKKKDIVTKRLRAQLAFIASVGE